MNRLLIGFLYVFVAAVSGGVFGLQYRVMRKFTVENSSFLSVFFATVPIPLAACWLLLPGWTDAIAHAGFAVNATVFVFGFCWGLGAITYAYGFNILGMALAASLVKGISIVIGSGVPLLRHWDQAPGPARTATILGLSVLIAGTSLAGWAGIRREHEMRQSPTPVETSSRTAVQRPTGRVFWIGLAACLASGVVSAFANLGYDRADAIEKAMVLFSGANLGWKATLVRWMPMYWGGMSALILFMGGTMAVNGSWRNYFAPGSGRDLLISSSMGGVHFLAQIPYGIGAFYLGTLGTTVGWGADIGMALVVASTLGFAQGEWKEASAGTMRTLCVAIAVLLAAIAVLAYANSLA